MQLGQTYMLILQEEFVEQNKKRIENSHVIDAYFKSKISLGVSECSRSVTNPPTHSLALPTSREPFRIP